MIALLAAVPLRTWLRLAAVAALVAFALLLRWHYIGIGERRVQALWDAASAKQTAATLADTERARAAEQRLAAEQSAIAWRLFQDNHHAKIEIDRLRADLAAGTLRLRQRFACPATRVPATPGTAAGSDGANATGFTAADAGIALGIAADGDRAVRALTACQALLKSDVLN